MKTNLLALQTERRIFLFRKLWIMLDYHLAGLYGVEIGALNQAFMHNADRYPDDYMFQLTAEEHEALHLPNWHSKGLGRTSAQPAFELDICLSLCIPRENPYPHQNKHKLSPNTSHPHGTS